MDRSATFNNAGVWCFEAGWSQMAWVLFKGALEVRRAAELEGQQRRRSGHDVAVMNTYIHRADCAYRQLIDHIERSGGRDASTTIRPVIDEMSTSGVIMSLRPPVGIVRSNDDDYYHFPELPGSPIVPFLYQRTFRLQEEGGGRRVGTTDQGNNSCHSTDPRSRSDSAAVIFNLALLDHLRNRSSQKVLSLYSLALTLISGCPVDRLSMALINNVGIWYYENGEVDGALYCMGHLAQFLRSTSESVLGGVDRDGLLSNVLWLVNPPCAASPAA